MKEGTLTICRRILDVQSSRQSRRDGDYESHGDRHVRWMELLPVLHNARIARDGLALRKLLSLPRVHRLHTRVHGIRDVDDDDNSQGKHEQHMR